MIYVLHNPIQNYPWGSRTILAELLRQPGPTSEPQAELWMGAHPKAPSQIQVDGDLVNLDRWICGNADAMLGSAVALRFGGQLPFLFKILAVATPLSVQAHPNPQQAVSGFQRENKLGIDLRSPLRNYKDNQHKPELICALTDFWMLNGFRKIDNILKLLHPLPVPELQPLLNALEKNRTSTGLAEFFKGLLTMQHWQQEQAVQTAIRFIKTKSWHDPIFHWMQRLYDFFPTDIGVLFPAILNLYKLAPGHATFIQSGRMHTYLQGTGIELMANSDNVLRCALTTKHKDIPELLNILHFEESSQVKIAPRAIQPCENIYPAPVSEFMLAKIMIQKDQAYSSRKTRSIEIMICTNGYAEIQVAGTTQKLPIFQGTSLLIPACVPQYSITGQATLYKATVPEVE